MPYDIPNLHVEYVRAEPPAVPTGFWRGVGPNNNVFAIECFMDELARKAGKDPVDFRRGMLDNTPRLQAALDLAAEKSDWGQPLPARVGRGVSVQPSFGSFIATVVEAEVDDSGEVHLRRVTCAVDTGIAVNPDTIMAQLEGGLIFGLTAALWGEITIDKGRVQQSNFHDYRMLRIDEAPKIDVHVDQERRSRPAASARPASPAARRRCATRSMPQPACALRRLPIDRAADRRGEEGMSAMRRTAILVIAAIVIVADRARRLDHPRAPVRSPLPAAPRLRWRIIAAPIRPAFRPSWRRRAWSSAASISRKAADCMVCHTTPGGKEYAGGLGFQAAVRHALFDQHHAGQGHRHRQLQRPGFSQRGPARHPPRRRAALSGHALHVLHLHDRRRRAGDQGLSVQPARRCARQRQRNTLSFPVQPALGDDLLVGGVQPGHALYAGYLEEPGVEQGRLSRRSAGALRRMPHAAQSCLCARQPQEIRRRRDGRLARLQHHAPTRAPASAPGATRRSVAYLVERTRARATARRRADGRSGRSQFQPYGTRRHPRARRLSAQRARRRLARPAGNHGAAGARLAQGGRAPPMRAARWCSTGACVSCHGWTAKARSRRSRR